jgi:hypothetical protein
MNGIAAWLRRGLGLSLLVLALAQPGCGGGSATVASMPGTGGTGFTSSGTVTGFGSVRVNGVFYDDSQATVTIDGAALPAAALGLGMQVTVHGQLGSVAATGTASSIDAWSQAQGAIASVGSGGFKVAGMSVSVDSSTVYLGVASGAALQAGMPVRVWAQATDAGLGRWLAARVELLGGAPAVLVTSGVVASGQLNGLTLAGSLASGLGGQSVRVAGTLVGNTLAVASVRQLSALPGANSDRDEVREGVITQLGTASTFLLGNLPIDASLAEVIGGGVSTGAKVEVTGRWVSGVFLASKIELESELNLIEVEIKGDIGAFVSLADFTVRGQRCDASGVTRLGGGKLSDLKTGVRVHLHGVKRGDMVQVTEIEVGS